ncbi:PhzF family phenazine biosynthesis protein [Ideonella sp.]|uniref:PhzF family phenazine biosynthesis protein n=1 Tax=Ideonella sp. TaxID=1929293 RepID=UPI0035AE1A92
MAGPSYFHVDVFAAGPLSGNGLAVFLDTDGWSAAAMQRITQEMRQFESIFLSRIGPDGAIARVFTVEEELPFAGHPVLGAAAVLHRALAPDAPSYACTLQLAHGPVAVRTERRAGHWLAEMNQGQASLGPAVPENALAPILAQLSLAPADLAPGLPARVVSTGLPYLVVPVRPDALARTAIQGPDLEAKLATLGAKFVFVLDAANRELRTWDNLGRVEDVATGSAAGPAAAYLFAEGLAELDTPIELAQGRFTGRPSRIDVQCRHDGALLVRGAVWPVCQGTLDLAFSELRS